MKKLSFLLFVFASTMLKAQNPGWIFAPNYVKNIVNQPGNQPLPVPTNVFGMWSVSNDPNNRMDGYDGQKSHFNSNIQMDLQGNIKFFIVDGYVYDGKGNTIGMLGGDAFCPGTSELMVVPIPGQCNRYYIFSAGRQGPYHKYAGVFLLDMGITNPNALEHLDPAQAQNFKGGLIKVNNNQEVPSAIPGIMAINYMASNPRKIRPYYTTLTPKDAGVNFGASKLRNGKRDIFITNTEAIHVYTLSNSGFVKKAFIPLPHMVYNNSELRGELELVRLNNGNYRIATPHIVRRNIGGVGVNESIWIFEYNPNTENVVEGSQLELYLTNQIQAPSEIKINTKGLEFSEDGRYLYVTHSTNNLHPNAFEYYDFNVGGSTLTPMNISNSSDYQFSRIERIEGNKLLIATQDGARVLNNMNNPNSGVVPFLEFNNYLNYEGTSYQVPLNKLKTYMLQDQIDGMDYEAHQIQDPLCCVTNTHYDQIKVTAYGDYTGVWTPGSNPLTNSSSNIITIKEELRIDAGEQVTIKDLTIKFAPGARLVIQNGSGGQQTGAKLTLINSTLTVDDKCGDDFMWLGVEVWGDQSQKQSGPYNKQGQLLMYNSKIEHAYIGALASKRPDPKNKPWKYSEASNGGIIRSYNSSFTNNIYGVYINKYLNPSMHNNLCYFSNTNFEWNSDMNGNPRTHAHLHNVKGITFSGCDFTLENPENYPPYSYGTGISSYESQFYVGSQCPVNTHGAPCPNPDNSMFKNLRMGIYSRNYNSLSYSVDQTDFINCTYGIYTSGTDRQRITRNNFEVKELPHMRTSGISLTRSTGYTIQENVFHEFDNPLIANGTGNSYGIVIDQSGEEHNEVYKNTFYDLKIGGQAQRVNGTVDATENNSSRKGLQWKCNHFRSGIYEADLGVNGIIDYQQGYLTGSSLLDSKRKAARNVFSMSGESSPVDHDIKVHPNSSEFQYVYIDNNDHKPDNYTEQKVSATCSQYMGQCVTDAHNTCPSKLRREIEFVDEDLFIKRKEIKKLMNKMDNGVTKELLNQLAGDKDDTYKLLMKASPYVSDNVLVGYVKSNPPQGYLKQVILANSPVSKNVYNVLKYADISNGTMRQIKAKQKGISEREYLLNEIAHKSSIISSIENDIKSRLLLDTNKLAGVEKYISFLQGNKDLGSIKDLYSIKMDQGDNSKENYSIVKYLKGKVCPEYFNLCSIVANLRNETSMIEALRTNPKYTHRLKEVIEKTKDIDVKESAISLLEMKLDSVEMFDFLPLGVNNNKILLNDSDVFENETNDFVFSCKIYPNPTEGIVFIDLDEKEDGEMIIKLADLTGKIVLTSKFSDTNGEKLDVSHLKTGSYLLNITLGGKYQETHLVRVK